ncbi:unnamed protein product [Rhizophagus irregularis]|nr:unnamed protein product [Rhizophagus irregularis]
MDKNAHKRSLFELYSSEEKIIDVDRLQEDYESESTLSNSSFEDSNEKCAIFGLEESDTFENWDLAERQVENYSKEVGFGIVRRRINKNRHGEIKRRTFECQNSRKYCAKKRADVEETRERESVKIGCPWKVNLSCNKGVIRVTSICKKHNHPLFGNRNIASDRHLSPEMLEEIEFLVNVGCEAGLIICMLQKWFPDAVIHPKNVYNAICLFRRDQKVMKTDAAETYDKLIKMQREEHGWFVEARLEGDDNHLTGFFWMRPSQIELWQKFHDVAINDNTSQINKYRMYLSLTIVIDNHVRSRMVATAVVSDETKETYQWILECLLHATNGLAPRVLFTDADAGMIAAIHETLPSTKHNYCIWHLRKNLEKNLKGKLRNKYNDFIKEWNKCRNSFSEEEFQRRWHGLLKNYPEAQKYLERALGTDVTGWALCFTHRSFNAGVQSTQRVESYNALIKKSVGSSTTLYELDIQIQLQFDKEEKFERLEEQVNQNPTIGLPNVIERYFKRIDGIIKKYLTPQVLKIQRRQMNESLLYCVKKIENWEHLLERKALNFDEKTNEEQDRSDDERVRSDDERKRPDGEERGRFDEKERERSDEEERVRSDEEERGRFDDDECVRSDDDERKRSDEGEWERSNKKEREGYDDYEWERYDNDELERYDDKGSDEKDSKVKFAEDDYESKLLNLRSLFSYLDHAVIHEVWSVTTIEQNKEHFVVLYVMFNSDMAMFHIGLIPARWYSDVFSSTQEELAVTVCGKKYASDDGKLVYEHQVLTNFDILNEIRHTQLFSETVKQNLSRKAKYNEGFGYAKRAIGLSLELRCENEINEILQSWIRKKEIEIRNRQLGRIIGSKENLPNISNPHHQTRTKGAPKKRVKNALENTTIKYSNNKNRQDIKKLNDKHHEKSIKELNKQPRNELQREISIHQTKYICSYCKGSGHNARSCELKKKGVKAGTR